jgi:hypothetical protein
MKLADIVLGLKIGVDGASSTTKVSGPLPPKKRASTLATWSDTSKHFSGNHRCDLLCCVLCVFFFFLKGGRRGGGAGL